MSVLRAPSGELRTGPIGLVTVTVVIVVLLLALNSGSLYRQLTSTTYSAYFPEAAGLATGDEVRLAGVVVGQVDALELRGNKVEATFTVFDQSRLGSRTGAEIKTATALGAKYIAVLPAGTGELSADEPIPLDRTSSPYDVQQILEDLTREVGELDVGRLTEALDTVSTTFADTPPELRTTIDGLGRLSRTIASRDEELETLLANTRGVTGILAERSGDLTTLISDGNLLLAELFERRETLRSLLRNLEAVVAQFEGLARDNQEQIGPALRELEQVLDLLNRNDKNLGAAVEGLRTYVGALGEAISSGPWFFALVPNLVPTNLAQQTLPSVLDQLTPASPTLPGVESVLPGGAPR